MSESEQRGLGEFEAPDEGRPDEEAAVVAGDAGQTVSEVVDAADLKFPDSEGVVELKVSQVDYTIEGSGPEEYPVVHVFGRTADNEPEHVRVLGVEPYFYVPTENVEDRALTEEYDPILDTREEDPSGERFESIRGRPLTKVIGRTPRDVGQMRDDFEEHYEADILFPNRFLIDKDVSAGLQVPERRLDDGRIQVRYDDEELVAVDAPTDADLRVNTFDIEVDDRSGFPEDGEEPIVCLTSHDSYDDEYVVWLFDAPDAEVDAPEVLDEYEQIADSGSVDVRVFDEEPAMLDAFVEYIEETNPDVLTGWNFEDFDMPYVLDRLEMVDPSTEYDLDIDRLSRVDEVWRSDWGGPDVKGRVVFDLLYGYKQIVIKELESFRLDAIGERELDVGKEHYSGDIGDLWEQDPEQLLEYNLRDVELCVEIDRKQSVIAFWDEVRSFVGCKLEDAPTAGDAVDMYVLHKAYGEFGLPSKGQQEAAEEFEGGAVFEPISGVKENVTVLDLKCFSGDTDVLTPEGPRNIQELSVDDEIYTLNPDTFECEVKPVAETHSYENSFGELHHLSGNTHDFKITENHRFLASKKRGWDQQDPDDFEFAEYRKFTNTERFAFPNHQPMDGRTPSTFDLIDEVDGGNVVVYSDDDLSIFRAAMPDAVQTELDLAYGSSEAMGLQQKVGKYLLPLERYREHQEVVNEHAADIFLKFDRGHRETPVSFEMSNWLELLGWYVTEGSLDRAAGRFTLHQNDDNGRERIQALLDEMEINYNVDERGVNVSNVYLLEWLSEHCGEGYADKQLPEWVFDLDGELLRRLLDTLVAGDGSTTDSGLQKFWTKSDHLKEAVVDIAVRCGEKPTVTKQNDGTWYVSIGKQGSFQKSTNAAVESHDGDVYCVTAEDNHVVLAGRNGHYQWVGQSLYPMSMATINSSPETKVDPDEFDGETYRAPDGTHFRKEPDGIMREMIDELLTEREEKKTLRDQHEPDSEAYERYDRQQGGVKVIMNCFTPDTDVLTPEGVRNIRDLEVGDEVYSLDPDTEEMEIKPVEDTHSYPDYEGELVDIETSKIDFSVTPNHRMLVRKNETNGITEDGFSFVEAGDLDRATNYELPHGWSTEHGDDLDTVDLVDYLEGKYEVWVRPEVHGHTFAAELGYYPETVLKNDAGEEGYVFDAEEYEEHREYIESVCERTFVHRESGRKWIPRTFDGDDFLDLLAWYITEGNVYTSEEKEFDGKLRGSATTVKIAQQPAVTDGGDGDHAVIGDLLDRMGFDYYADENGYQFTSRLLGETLERLCGGDSFEKRIPEFVFDLSERQKRRFLDTLVDGDGDRQPNSWRYTTSSERLRDDVLRLCTHLGLTANYGKNGGSWRIYVDEGAKNTLRMHRSGSTSTADDGVYCVTVADNHSLLAGRNGTFQFVGQSLYGVSGWDRFRLYDTEGAAAVTATGREVIEFTETAAEEIGHEVAYGDTDSVMLSLGEQISKDDAIDQSFAIEEHINERYDDFAREELDADSHRFEIEFEKLYRRFFQAGKKKRYAGHIVWKEGKDVDDIDITGFEYKRSDIAPVTKRVQKEVIDMIVRGGELDDVKEYLHDEITTFEEGEADLDEVGIPGGIGKRLDAYDTDTAQVRGAKYANLLLGTNFQRGSKPKRLYLKKVHPEFWRRMENEQGFDPQTDPLYREFKRDPDVICYEYAEEVPEEFEVDWPKMLDKTLKGPIERVIEALGLSWDEVKSGQEQTGLGQWG
ncbi:DNA polymerase domain-containing protein [Halolamina sediminis]|uniref:DNA polymerase domain-containing protein n=1 Tax=Halolamina sediminis TaxID=1480675 RepID=UPI0006B48AA5|nr:DNA polymerase domain-containing protein [Halolamina sediminis]